MNLYLKSSRVKLGNIVGKHVGANKRVGRVFSLETVFYDRENEGVIFVAPPGDELNVRSDSSKTEGNVGADLLGCDILFNDWISEKIHLSNAYLLTITV